MFIASMKPKLCLILPWQLHFLCLYLTNSLYMAILIKLVFIALWLLPVLILLCIAVAVTHCLDIV